MEAQTQNERLQHECNTMVNNYSRKIEAQEDTIRSLNQRMEHQGNLASADPDYEGMLKRENDALKRENTLMRERVADLSREVEGGQGMSDAALDNECRRLRSELQEKEREVLKQGDQMRQLLTEKEQVSSKQKNEWAEIYGNMKRETDGLKRDIRMLNKENERLVKQIESNRGTAPAGGTNRTQQDTAHRLKKRELECSALWETLRDMYSST